jgi:predicted protein tyrosine phosphatase
MGENEIVIEVVSRLEAAEILTTPVRCAEVTFLVSIGHGDDELPTGYHNVRRKLRLLIADVNTEDGASEADVRQLIEFAESVRPLTGKVLIHCEAGISRSPAAALIMYACWLGPGRELEAMEHVLVQRPGAIPNRRMVEVADNLLARSGRLVAVLSLCGTYGSSPD